MQLIDNYQRKVNYLRLSVTDRCNLRCCYCMPASGVPACSHAEILSYEELLRISRCAAELGIEKVRVTGGEPLVRKGLLQFLTKLNSISGIREVALTTNGILLNNMAKPLRQAGVGRVNVSLDSLQAERYAEITRGGSLQKALSGLEQAEQAGLGIKLNMVVMRGINDSEIEDFAALSLKRLWAVRFIEYMPVVREKAWRSRVLPGSEVLSRLGHRYQLEELPIDRLGGPARSYRIGEGVGTIGVITPMSEHFCHSCNRLRVTSRGMVKGCLLDKAETDLRPYLAATGDDRLRAVLQQAVTAKNQQHELSSHCENQDAFAMVGIGG